MLSLNKESIKEFVKKIKIEYLIVVALGIVAIFIFASTKDGKSQPTSVNSYVSDIENKLESCLSKVKGAGKVEVIVSVSGGMENVLATKNELSSGGKVVESPLIVNGKAVVVKEKYPEISGVIIVSQGANNLAVRMDILDAATCFLNIPSERIQILSMK